MIPFSIIGTLFVFDTLLFPIGHIGGMPFKLSYLLAAMWPLHAAADPRAVAGPRGEEIRPMLVLFAMLGGVSIVGQAWLTTRGVPLDPGELPRSLAIYGLAALSFALGVAAPRSPLRWLPLIVIVACAANLAVAFGGRVGSMLTRLYYDPLVAEGATGLVRSIGLFGNPNVSMGLVNVPLLFVVISLRRGILSRPPAPIVIVLAVLPLATALVLQTRTEALISLVLGAALTWTVFGQTTRPGAPLLAVILLAAIGVTLIFLIKYLAQYVGLIEYALGRFSGTRLLDLEQDRAFSILRPLLVWEEVGERFAHSPLFGSGFSTLGFWPYEESPRTYHNDWFRIAITAGLAGLAVMVIIVKRLLRIAGWFCVVPFVLPGLTNTFLLNIPAVMFYFFATGVISQAGIRSSPRAAARSAAATV